MSYRRRRPRSAILSNVPSRRSYIEALISEEDLLESEMEEDGETLVLISCLELLLSLLF